MVWWVMIPWALIWALIMLFLGWDRWMSGLVEDATARRRKRLRAEEERRRDVNRAVRCKPCAKFYPWNQDPGCYRCGQVEAVHIYPDLDLRPDVPDLLDLRSELEKSIMHLVEIQQDPHAAADAARKQIKARIPAGVYLFDGYERVRDRVREARRAVTPHSVIEEARQDVQAAVDKLVEWTS